MPCRERRDRLGHEPRSHRAGRRDAQWSSTIATLVLGDASDVVGLLEELHARVEDPLTGTRERDTARVALEEYEPERLLEQPHAAAHRGLLDTQRRCCAREAGVACDRIEMREMPELDRHRLILSIQYLLLIGPMHAIGGF